MCDRSHKQAKLDTNKLSSFIYRGAERETERNEAERSGAERARAGWSGFERGRDRLGCEWLPRAGTSWQSLVPCPWKPLDMGVATARVASSIVYLLLLGPHDAGAGGRS